MDTVVAVFGGVALASVPIVHWFATRRSLAVSGRVTALVNRALDGPVEDSPELSPEELMAAVERAALERFGADAVDDPASDAVDDPASGGPADETAAPLDFAPPPAQPLGLHLGFLVAIGVGGFLAALAFGKFDAVFAIRGATWTARYGAGLNGPGVIALLLGGVAIGFGTRMSGGCTSGHGLCGTSRFEKGSLVATAAFFGTGMLTTLLLSRVLGS